MLLLGPPLGTAAGPPGIVNLDSGAWAVVHAGQLWVCWEQADNCWRRVELAPPTDLARVHDLTDDLGEDFIEDGKAERLDASPERWRLGFWGPRTLWVELGEQRWRVDLGHQRARATADPAPLRLVRPGMYTCGPAGRAPAIVGGRLGWQPAPRCGLGHGQSSCLAPPPPRVRRPRAVGLRASVQLSSSKAWTTRDDHIAALQVAGVRANAGVEFTLALELGFDIGRARTQQRARAIMRRRDPVRNLPTTPAPRDPQLAAALAPIAAAEARALRVALCEGAGQ
ncbi:hypothetical protein ENSA7_29420 [Enhygromyxa salina]|uniref:Uncharacterized protein n=2 Tax=Enhygromyxa salina TaxID=215803 RepID=A0A2S9YQ59_9BACT|nr:hypothetical protein ENSA7_29420 [Enhygromyxa salina]